MATAKLELILANRGNESGRNKKKSSRRVLKRETRACRR